MLDKHRTPQEVTDAILSSTCGHPRASRSASITPCAVARGERDCHPSGVDLATAGTARRVINTQLSKARDEPIGTILKQVKLLARTRVIETGCEFEHIALRSDQSVHISERREDPLGQEGTIGTGQATAGPAPPVPACEL